MGRFLSRGLAQRIFFSFIGSLFDLTAVSSFRRALCSRRRAQGPSGLAVAPTFPHAPPWPVRVESAMRRITDIGEQPPAASINEYAPSAPWATFLSPGCQDQCRGREDIL